MKKIFAIALAVVMVLSMASAFALNACSTNFAWPCDTTKFCGFGTVEVVPFVRVNGCGSSEFQISECAGVVSGENIYYAIKLNVEANPDAANNYLTTPQAGYKWDLADVTQTKLDVTVYPAAGVTPDVAIAGLTFDSTSTTDGIDWDADKAKSYWYVANPVAITTEWIDVTDEAVDFSEIVITAAVAANVNASSVKVCAELISEHSGLGTWTYGDYTVEVAVGSLKVTKGGDTYEYTDGDVDEVKATNAFAKEVEGLLNLNGCSLGTCLTAANIQKNFGWKYTDGALKDCFKWSANASAIVDSDCVVAIPKTGDASLLWWLF